MNHNMKKNALQWNMLYIFRPMLSEFKLKANFGQLNQIHGKFYSK